MIPRAELLRTASHSTLDRRVARATAIESESSLPASLLRAPRARLPRLTDLSAPPTSQLRALVSALVSALPTSGGGRPRSGTQLIHDTAHAELTFASLEPVKPSPCRHTHTSVSLHTRISPHLSPIQRCRLHSRWCVLIPQDPTMHHTLTTTRAPHDDSSASSSSNPSEESSATRSGQLLPSELIRRRTALGVFVWAMPTACAQR